MKQKYYIPYLYITLRLVGIMTALLFLIGRTENHVAIVLCILVGLVWILEALLWKLLFRHWCKASYWRMAEHVGIINISAFEIGYVRGLPKGIRHYVSQASCFATE